jgi:hypothetical protein
MLKSVSWSPSKPTSVCVLTIYTEDNPAASPLFDWMTKNMLLSRFIFMRLRIHSVEKIDAAPNPTLQNSMTNIMKAQKPKQVLLNFIFFTCY